jgi:hypothetical protein
VTARSSGSRCLETIGQSVRPARSRPRCHGSPGRRTIRQLRTSRELNLALGDQWRHVAQVFLLERWVVRNGKTTYESVCGLTSLPTQPASPARLLALVQAYWKIENRCHWRRDATLLEGACIVRHALVACLLSPESGVMTGSLIEYNHFESGA